MKFTGPGRNGFICCSNWRSTKCPSCYAENPRMSNLVSQWKSLLIWDSLYDYLSCKWVEVALHSREKNNLLISKWFCFFITEEFQKFRKVLFILSPAPPFPSQSLVLVCSSLVQEPAWSRWRRGLSSSCRTPWCLGTTLVNNVKIT